MQEFGIGIIGAGNISTTYLTFAPIFKGLNVVAIADINVEAAKARAAEYGVAAQSVEDLLANPKVDVVINLTIPDVHAAITTKILQAGKHAYSEKPLCLTLDEGEAMRTLAANNDLRVGCAPDTFLGGAHQFARHLIDEGKIGHITAGSAAVMSQGMEHWHPNPDFFFLPGGGPMLDLGPYYIANLINLIGPIKRVGALTSAAQSERTISTPGPRVGETVPVKTPTNIHGLLEFHSGATVTISTSWDVFAHKHQPMEIYGKGGSLFVPDPNFFGGLLEIAGCDGMISTVEQWDHPFGISNQDDNGTPRANYRTAGLADMVAALHDGRDHRCSLDRTLHGVDVMTSLLKSGETGEFISLSTTCTQPAALNPDAALALLKA